MKKLNITKKLMIPIAILVLALLCVSFVSILQIIKISNLSNEASISDERVQHILGRNIDHINWVMALRDSIENGENFIGESDPMQCSFGKWIYSDEVQSLDDAVIRDCLKEIEPYHNELHQSAIIVNEMITKGNLEEAKNYYKDTVVVLLSNITDILDKLEDEFDYNSDIATENLKATQAVTQIILIVVSTVGLILGVLLAVLIIIQIIKRLKLNMNELSKSASLVYAASTQLASAGEQLSEGSSEQAASIEETSATMDETASMVKRNAENTKYANDLSREASEAAAVGSDKMNNMTKSMEELKKSSSDISKIIKVIDEIAFQTNMLALNAAVEAARAGDAGQGFAVVATEVRNLAQKSAQAAKDTAEIIEKNIELSEHGAVISKDVNVALNEIMEKTKNVNQLIVEIASASDEQARGTSQVTDAISQMEKVVQINAATAEESAASSEELQTQAKALEGIVGELSRLVKGDKGVEMVDGTYDNNAPIKKNAVKKSVQNKELDEKSYVIAPNKVIPLDENDDF